MFDWKLSEWIRDRFERTIGELTLWIEHPVEAETFMNSPDRFFPLRVLIHESFSKT